MKKTTLILAILTISAIVLTACGAQTEADNATPAAVTPPALIAEGRLYPANTLDQSFSIPGQVAEVLVQDGDLVAAGQPLARLTASPETELALANAQLNVLNAEQALDALKTPADLNLAQARLAVLNAQEALDKAQEDFDADDSQENQLLLDAAKATLLLQQDALDSLESGKGINPDALTAAEARLSAAQAALTSAQAAADARTLTATISGSVIDLNLQPGQRISAGAPLITLADLSTWVVKTDNLTEMDIPAVSLGQKVEIVFDAVSDLTLNGQVIDINTRFEEKRGDVTYTVTIQLPQADSRLRWGMTAAVKFEK